MLCRNAKRMWLLYVRLSYAKQDEWNTSDNDSLTAAADEDDPNMDDFYQRVVLSDDRVFFYSDDGSVTDLDSDKSDQRERIGLF